MSNKKEPTKEQQRIIDDDGKVAVIANPGSGKTFTIVKKYLNNCYHIKGLWRFHSQTKRVKS